MAKQNFMAGGFYGKLGEVVGQRWKNKRTLRTYVIPRNPKTEAQMANRAKFAGIIPYAQLGMACNKGASAFLSNEITEWQGRVSAASYARDNGLTGLNLIPLYPPTFVAPHPVSDVKLAGIEKDEWEYFSMTGSLPTGIRKMTVVATGVKGAPSEDTVYIFYAEYEQTEEYNLRVSVPAELEIVVGTKMRVVTRDDVNSANDMIASSEMNVKQFDITVKDFDTTITAITHAENKYYIDFAQPFTEGEPTVSDVKIIAVVNGNWKTLPLENPVLTKNNGFARLEGDITLAAGETFPAFPTNSSVSMASIEIDNLRTVYIATNAVASYSDNDLQRTLSATITAVPEEKKAVCIKAVLPSGGWLNAEPKNVSVTLNYNAPEPGYLTESVQASVTPISATEINLISSQGANEYPCIKGCTATVPNFSIVCNGVTYNIAGITMNEYKNGADKINIPAKVLNLSYQNPYANISCNFAQTFIGGVATISSISIKDIVCSGYLKDSALDNAAIEVGTNGYTLKGTIAQYDLEGNAIASTMTKLICSFKIESDIYVINGTDVEMPLICNNRNQYYEFNFDVIKKASSCMSVTIFFGDPAESMAVETIGNWTLTSNKYGVNNGSDVLTDVSKVGASNYVSFESATPANKFLCKVNCKLKFPEIRITKYGVTYYNPSDVIGNFENGGTIQEMGDVQSMLSFDMQSSTLDNLEAQVFMYTPFKCNGVTVGDFAPLVDGVLKSWDTYFNLYISGMDSSDITISGQQDSDTKDIFVAATGGFTLDDPEAFSGSVQFEMIDAVYTFGIKIGNTIIPYQYTGDYNYWTAVLPK